MTKPLPCPFCGSDASVDRRSDDHIRGSRVRCPNWQSCSVLPGTQWCKADEEAIARWNTRAPRSDHE